MNNFTKSLKARAIALLARREYSQAELYEKLNRYENDAALIHQLLKYLIEQGFLSDERFIASYLRTHQQKFGNHRLVYALKQKGISEELLSSVKNDLELGELDRAKLVWQKKFLSLPKTAQEKSKQIRFLQSRGFDGEIIFQLFNLIRKEGIKND